MNENERLARAAHAALMQRVKERSQAEPGRYHLPAWEENYPYMHDDFKAVALAVVDEMTNVAIGIIWQQALIFDRIAEWSRVTFRRSTLQSTFEHLKREMAELEKDPANPGEQADISHLIVQLARLSGHDPMAELEKKFAENQARTWQEPDEQNVVEHVRTSVPETFILQQAVEHLIKEIESTEGEVHNWEATLDYIGGRARRFTIRIWTHTFVRDYWYNATDNTWHHNE